MKNGDEKAEEIRKKTDSMIDKLLNLMEANDLQPDWQAWHPHRLATAAAYLHLFVDPPTQRMSQWHARIFPKHMYIPADRIHCLPTLASQCLPLHAPSRATLPPPQDAVVPRISHASLGEGPCQAFVTAPVVCELCHKGFIGKDALASHCEQVHGNWAEYRKRVFYKAMKDGLQPQQPWTKRAYLNAQAFFLRHSVPSSYNDYTTKVLQAVPRRQEACAICAIPDWIENRFRMYLFDTPEGTLTKKHLFYGQGNDVEDESATEDHSILHRGGIPCVGDPEKVDKILSVYNYIRDWPRIPVEELHASSVQHPDHEGMRWLLHSRRVPKTECDDGDDAALPPCAGIGEKDAFVWACWDCVSSLCRRSGPVMPSLALVNWMWLGREHPLYRDLSLGMRILLGLGRPVMTSLFLGRGPRDEVHQGLTGNTMIVAQPSATYEQVQPNVHHTLDKLVLMFCKSVEDVSRAQVLVVERARYAECMQRRIAVCPTFANVRLDEEAMVRDLPESGVPEAFIQRATAMPEAASMRTTMDGPASRHSQFGPNPEEESEHTSDEEPDPAASGSSTAAPSGVQPAASCQGSVQAPATAQDTERGNTEEPLNEFETIIGVDSISDEQSVNLFATMQDKLELLTREAGKLAHATAAAEQIPTGIIAAEEQCRRIVIDVQDVARKLSKACPQKLEASISQSVHPGVDALAVPTGKPMSSFHPSTYSAAYVEFQFGDACPFLDRPRKIACKTVFKAFLCREELEYTLKTDVQPYCARNRSRFDKPEFVAFFADQERRMITTQSVSAALRREGFQKDEKAIASTTSEQLLNLVTELAKEQNGHTAPASACHHPKAPTSVHKALQNLMFSTATAPLTDGNKMRLRHLGHAMTKLWGPLTLFSTHNYADNYSPLMKLLCEGDGEMPEAEEPTMPTLQQMHRMTAASPVSTAKFWLLRQELAYRHFYGMDAVHIGKHFLPCFPGKYQREDHLANVGHVWRFWVC